MRPLDRERLLYWSKWYVQHKDQIFYEMIRPIQYGVRLPITDDCSGTVTNIYRLAGASDPNGLHYNGEGTTDTLAQHGQAISAQHVRVGDLVIYYDGYGWSPSNTEHVAILVNDDKGDPLTMSHGWSGEPAYVRVSQDGRPHRYFRYAVNER